MLPSKRLRKVGMAISAKMAMTITTRSSKRVRPFGACNSVHGGGPNRLQGYSIEPDPQSGGGTQ